MKSNVSERWKVSEWLVKEILNYKFYKQLEFLKKEWQRTFCIMGQQVNVKCKMKNLSESNLIYRESISYSIRNQMIFLWPGLKGPNSIMLQYYLMSCEKEWNANLIWW